MTARAPLCLLFALTACNGDKPEAKPEAEAEAEDSGGAGGADGADPACPPAPLPVAQAYLPNFTGAEDFAFDPEGYLVSVDPLGNLIGIRRDGTSRLIVPDISAFSAGTRFHPGGELLLNAADRGELLAINTATGGSRVVLGGLEYPNGLEVDADGFAYVAEQISGRVRRVDVDTGDFTFIARGLFNPNGLSFSPDEDTLYIGSFGGGTVWSLRRGPDGGWSEAAVFAQSPESPGVPPNPCADVVPGASCALNTGGMGACDLDELGDARCLPALDEAACAGLEAGADCSTELFGETIAQRCASVEGGPLFCPALARSVSDPCKAAAPYEACAGVSGAGTCFPTFEGVLGCYADAGFEAAYTRGCAERVEGDDCFIYDTHYPSLGVCQPGAIYGLEGLACLPEFGTSEHGGLDGVAADVCGNVYVSEYVLGEIWRFSAAGAAAERVATLDSEWIPNLRWGNGVGGWARDTLYVMDRENAGVFELFVGVEGR